MVQETRIMSGEMNIPLEELGCKALFWKDFWELLYSKGIQKLTFSFTFSLLHMTRESLFETPTHTHTHTHTPQIKNTLGIKKYISIKAGRARSGERNTMAHHSRKLLEFMSRLATSWFSICFGSPWAGLHITSRGADSCSKGCLS